MGVDHEAASGSVMYYKCMSHTAFNLDGAVLAVERVVVQVHHAGERRCEPHAVCDAAVAAETHQLVPLRHVVEKTKIIPVYNDAGSLSLEYGKNEADD